MISPRIMQVFFGDDLLPYKDSARTIHYPITQGSFLGSNNTKQVRFYVRDIGGTNNISWVVVSKLPNGKIGYEVCSNVQVDSELGEQYLSFDLSAYYTQAKGDLYLALRGYQGEITFEDDDDDGVYTISGDPLIEVTGTIKLAINYSPMINTGTQVLPTDVDRLITALSNYLKISEGIMVIDNLSIDVSGYNEGQLFFVKETSKFYELVSGTLTEIELSLSELNVDTINVSQDINITNFNDIKNGNNDKLIDYLQVNLKYLKKFDYATYHITTSTTLDELFAIIGDQPAVFEYNPSWKHWYLVRIEKTSSYYTFDFENLADNSYRYQGSIAVGSGSITLGDIINNSGTYYKPYSTKKYVDDKIADFLQKEYQKVDTTTYPTLNDFLASTGVEGYIYLYPIDTSDPTKGYYQYIYETSDSEWVSLGTTQIDLSGYVQKTSVANKVYGTNDQGADTTYTVDDFYDGNIARRDSDGSITVPLTPTSNGEATSKKYVDDSFVFATNSDIDNLF